MRETAATVNQSPAQQGVKTSGADDWLTSGRFALALGILVVATFPNILLSGETFVLSDFGLYGCPLAYFHRACFWNRELAMWNPLSHCGVPFLAQWNTMVLYPPSLIYLLLPLPWSLSLFCLAHLFWGGLGTYFLAYHWTGNRWAAALAGVLFAFNGLTLSSLIWPSQEATWSWVPWVVWLAQRAWLKGGKHLVPAVIGGSLQMSAGGPETILMTWLILIVLALVDWLNTFRIGKDRNSVRTPVKLTTDESSVAGEVAIAALHEHSKTTLWYRFLGVAALVTLVSSAQLLPFLELLAHSQRDSGYGSGEWSLSLSGLANFLVPLFRTYPTEQGIFVQSGQGWITSYYAGVATIWLIAIALGRASDRRLLLLVCLALVGLSLAMGSAGLVYPALRSWFPAIGFVRYPVKFVVITVALLPVLAAIGFRSLMDAAATRKNFERGFAVLLLILIGTIILVDWKFPQRDWPITFRNGITRAGFFVLIVGLFFLFLRSHDRQQIGCGCLLIAAVWLDLATHVPTQNPTAPSSALSPNLARANLDWRPEPRLGESRAMLTPAAVSVLLQHTLPEASAEKTYLLDRLAMLPNCNLLDRVPLIDGFFPLVPKEVNYATGIPYVRTNHDFSALLDFMGVIQITAPGTIFNWKARPTAMPLVTAGQQPIFADEQTTISYLSQTNVDFREVVLLPREARERVSATRQTETLVEVSKFANESVRMDTAARAPSMIVISQTYYPGWTAYVDGKPATIWRANYAFQALEVSAGRHKIELRYENRTFLVGMFLSGLGLLASFGLWWRGTL